MSTVKSIPQQGWSQEAIQSLLKARTAPLQGLSDTALRDFVAAGRVEFYAAGTRISSRGEKRTHAILVLDGVLRVYSVSLDGREYLLSMLEPGAFYGLLASLDGDPSPHDAVAGEDMSLFLIPASAFKRLMTQHPDFRDTVFGILCSRLRQAFSMLDQFAIGSPRERLANRLLALASAYGRPAQNGTEIDLHLTQDSLAAMIGLSRQRTNLLLKAFESEGLISLTYGRVVIHRPDDLASMDQAIDMLL